MRIVCDNCAAKYQISDEKVRNKVFKIRCKRCAHVIVVRANEQGERAEAPAQVAAESVEAAPAAVQAAAGAVWYVVVNREQVGPLTPDQVLAHFERGEVDADTFTWAEGMADWVRLATIPEFADHVAAAAPAPAAPAAAEPAPTEQLAVDQIGGAAAPAAQASASLFDDGGDDDVIASNNQSESLFGDDNDGFDGGGPRVSSGQQLRNQRNENSVLFSLDSLAADAEPMRAGGGGMVSNTGGSDASGLIDISALGPSMGAPVAAAALDDAFGGATGGAAVFAPVAAAPAGPMPTYVTRPTGGGGKVAIFALLGLLVLGGGGFAAWYFLVRDTGPGEGVAPASVAAATTPSAAAAGPATVAIGTPATAAPVSAPATAASAASAASVASAAPETEPAAAPESVASARKPTRTTRRPTRRATRTTPRPKATAEDKPPVAAAPKTAAPRRAPKKSAANSEVDDLLGGLGKPAAKRPTRSAPAAGGGSDPMLPEKLSKSQILRVVRTNAGKISGCKNRDPGASGTVKVVMVIGKSGRVNSAKAGGPFAGTPVGSCVEGKVKSFRFPQFSGDDMRINMPFRL